MAGTRRRPLPASINPVELAERIRDRYPPRRRETCPDPEDPWGVLAWAHRHHQELRDAASRAGDALDRMLLVRHIAPLPDRWEHTAMEQALAVGLSYQQLAAPLGLTNRQDVEKRLVRHRAAADRLPRDPTVYRAAQRDRTTRRTGALARADEIRAAATDLIRHRYDLAAAEDEWVEWVDYFLQDGGDTVSGLAALATALGRAVHAVQDAAEHAGTPAASTPAARAALRRAAEVCEPPRPTERTTR